jgi:regulator of cell morphogenesis and NO signaling
MTVSDSTLRSIALAEPATIRVFEGFHLDYCCGGNRPLREACTEKGLEIESVLAALAAATGGAEAEAGDFSMATLAELIGHIVAKHHAYVRGELPRLLPMAEKVAAKHGPKHPEFRQIEQQLRVLAGELTLHLHKEETILFPYIEALERNIDGAGGAPHACFGTVEGPIHAMMNEHEAAGALLESMRASTEGFTPPAWGCPTVVGLLHGLDAFEKDLHRHVHLENNLLFPRAIAVESELMAKR